MGVQGRGRRWREAEAHLRRERGACLQQPPPLLVPLRAALAHRAFEGLALNAGQRLHDGLVLEVVGALARLVQPPREEEEERGEEGVDERGEEEVVVVQADVQHPLEEGQREGGQAQPQEHRRLERDEGEHAQQEEAEDHREADRHERRHDRQKDQHTRHTADRPQQPHPRG